jgi:hypothetical protein
MPRERIDPVTNEDGDEKHPAFGMIGVHRISSSPGETLFQSDVQHPHLVRVEVREATRKRDLKQDWVYPGRLLCEVSMSEAQFASFVASGGTSGVPATIEFAGSGSQEPGARPGLNPAPRLALSHEELRAAAEETYSQIQADLRDYQETLALSGKGSAAAQRKALANLQAAVNNAASNVAYTARRLDEHAEKVVENARTDIEAMAVHAAAQLGVPVSEIRAIETGEPQEAL